MTEVTEDLWKGRPSEESGATAGEVQGRKDKYLKQRNINQ